MEETQGVVGSAETGSPSRGTLASLREASTSPFLLQTPYTKSTNCMKSKHCHIVRFSLLPSLVHRLLMLLGSFLSCIYTSIFIDL